MSLEQCSIIVSSDLFERIVNVSEEGIMNWWREIFKGKPQNSWSNDKSGGVLTLTWYTTFCSLISTKTKFHLLSVFGQNIRCTRYPSERCCMNTNLGSFNPNTGSLIAFFLKGDLMSPSQILVGWDICNKLSFRLFATSSGVEAKQIRFYENRWLWSEFKLRKHNMRHS